MRKTIQTIAAALDCIRSLPSAQKSNRTNCNPNLRGGFETPNFQETLLLGAGILVLAVRGPQGWLACSASPKSQRVTL